MSPTHAASVPFLPRLMACLPTQILALGAEAAALNGRPFSRTRGIDAGGTLLGHKLPEKKVDYFIWDREFSFYIQSRHSQRLLLDSWDSSIKVYGKVRPWVECEPHPRGFQLWFVGHGSWRQFFLSANFFLSWYHITVIAAMNLFYVKSTFKSTYNSEGRARLWIRVE